MSIVARAIFSEPGTKHWDPTADVNGDSRVDLSDLFGVLDDQHDPDCRKGNGG